jgi:hypothetical protein
MCSVLSKVRWCPNCKKIKLREEFHNAKGKLDGKQAYCKPCQHKVRTKNIKEYRRKNREAHLRDRHGISEEEYLEILKFQNGKCAICGKTEGRGVWSTKNLFIDHCHKTRRIRGLLCDSCNRGIGLLQENPDLLRAAADYLEDEIELACTQERKPRYS